MMSAGYTIQLVRSVSVMPIGECKDALNSSVHEVFYLYSLRQRVARKVAHARSSGVAVFSKYLRPPFIKNRLGE